MNITSLSTSVLVTSQTPVKDSVPKRLPPAGHIQLMAAAILAELSKYLDPKSALYLLTCCLDFKASALTHALFKEIVRCVWPHLYPSLAARISEQPQGDKALLGLIWYRLFGLGYRPNPAPIILSQNESNFFFQNSNILQLTNDHIAFPCTVDKVHLFALDGSESAILDSGLNSSSRVTQVLQLADNRIAARLECGQLCLWSLGDPQPTILTDKAEYCVELQNRCIAWGSKDGSITMCKPNGSELVRSEGSRGAIEVLKQLADGRILSVGVRYDTEKGVNENIISIMSLDGSDPIILPTAFTRVHDTTLLKDGRIAVAYNDDSIRIWSRESLDQTITGKWSSIMALETLTDGRIIVQSASKLCIISVDTSASVTFQMPNNSHIVQFHQATNGCIVVVCARGRVMTWSLSGSLLYSSKCFDPTILFSACAGQTHYLRDGRLVCKGRKALVIDGISGDELFQTALG